MKTFLPIVAGLLVAAAFAAQETHCQAQATMPPVQGIWDSQYPTIWGNASERLILLHNGTFTKTFRCQDKMHFSTGKYLVGPGFIRLYHDRGPIKTETTWVQFRSPTVMDCHDRITGGRWVAQRVGP